MAEEINLIVNVDKGNTKSVADVRKELEEAKKSATDTGKALNEGLATAETKTISLKAQLKAMKNELLGMTDTSSPAFKKLSKEAADLEDRIGDVNARVKALSSDTKRLDALVGIGGGIAAGFQAAQGAMALFGTDSKKVEKAIQNIIAAQGLLNGVQTIANLLQKEHIVGQYARIAVEKTAQAATKAATVVQWLWNAALTANPIGVVVVAVAALGAGIYALAKGLKDGTITIQDINKVLWRMIMPLQLIVDLYNYLTDAASNSETVLERNSRQGEERYQKEKARLNELRALEKEAFEEKQTQFDLDIARTEAEGKSVKALQEAKLNAILEEKKAMYQHNVDLINLMVKRYEFEAQLRGKSLDEFLKSIGINYEQTKAALEESLQSQKDAIFSAETDIIALKRSSNETQNDDLKKALEEQERIRKLEQEKHLEYLYSIEQADRLFAERLAEEKERQRQIELEQREADSKAAIEAAEKEIELEKQKNAAKQKIAENYAKSVIDLSETIFTLTNAFGKKDEESRLKRAKRQFEISKALSVAEATISTINGVVNALTEKSVLPAPLSTILRASNAIAVGVAGAANIAKIASQKFEGGGGGDAVTSLGGGDVGSAIAQTGEQEPNVQPIQSGSTFLNKEPQQVLVVEDVSKMQTKVSAIEALASAG